MKIESDTFLTSSEVGQLLQVNPSSVKKWMDDGKIQGHRTPGGHRRIRAGDLAEFLANNKMPIPRDLAAAGRRRILIVDDDLAQLKAIGRAFKRHADKLEVVTTANGIDALILVGSYKPHYVLLDVVMPGVDGIEVCKRLKVNPETSGIAVVIMSGHLTPAIRKKALAAGALRCIEKPVNVEVVVDLLEATIAPTAIQARG